MGAMICLYAILMVFGAYEIYMYAAEAIYKLLLTTYLRLDPFAYVSFICILKWETSNLKDFICFKIHCFDNVCHLLVLYVDDF